MIGGHKCDPPADIIEGCWSFHSFSMLTSECFVVQLLSFTWCHKFDTV